MGKAIRPVLEQGKCQISDGENSPGPWLRRQETASVSAAYGVSSCNGEEKNDEKVLRRCRRVSCCRFQRHRVRCLNETGGAAWRRKFTREFKVEAVKLIRERGVTVAQASRDLAVDGTVLRRWVQKCAADSQQAFPGQGQMKPEQAELARLRREVLKLKNPQPTSQRRRCDVRLY